jgi:hypothetical protein
MTTPSGSGQPETMPQAGWYRDPAGGAGHRWWDGSVWTGHFLADRAPAPEGSSPPPRVPDDDASEEQEASRLVRMGLVLLVLEALFPLLGIAVLAAGGALILKRRVPWGLGLVVAGLVVFAFRISLSSSLI